MPSHRSARYYGFLSPTPTRQAARQDIALLGRRALKLLAGTPLPAHWIYPAPPPESQRAARNGRLAIEIVSHCWGYSRLLAYQLTSLIDHPVHDADVTMTVFYSREDTATTALLDFIGTHRPAHLTWNWQALDKERLFRRSIGRNLAAKASSADWVWFTDCDLTFQPDCLDSLNRALQDRRDALVHPRIEGRTNAYSETNTPLPNALETPALLRVDNAEFHPNVVTRATGPLQITHGDVARAVGYCEAVPYYQTPQSTWQKAEEDRMFRWLLGTPGTPIDVEGVCRVQHVHKGRYGDAGVSASTRQGIRRWQDKLRRLRR